MASFSIKRDGLPAPFYGHYGSNVNIDKVTGLWHMSGPQTEEMIPKGLVEVFKDPKIQTVIIIAEYVGDLNQGCIISRNKPEGGETNEPDNVQHPGAGS